MLIFIIFSSAFDKLRSLTDGPVQVKYSPTFERLKSEKPVESEGQLHDLYEMESKFYWKIKAFECLKSWVNYFQSVDM